MDVANLKTSEDQTVKIIISQKNSVSFNINSADATDYLARIYLAMHDFSDLKACPINYIDKDYQQFSSFVYDMKREWDYQNGKEMFDFSKQLGYDSSDVNKFLNDYHKKCQDMRQLIAFLEQ